MPENYIKRWEMLSLAGQYIYWGEINRSLRWEFMSKKPGVEVGLLSGRERLTGFKTWTPSSKMTEMCFRSHRIFMSYVLQKTFWLFGKDKHIYTGSSITWIENYSCRSTDNVFSILFPNDWLIMCHSDLCFCIVCIHYYNFIIVPFGHSRSWLKKAGLCHVC